MFHLDLNGRQLQICLVDATEPRYGEAAALARGVYRQSYGASIAPRPDHFIVCVSSDTQQMLACAGLCYGGAGALFSEQYLHEPLDQTLERIFEREVDRSEIGEISALATLEPTIGTELVRAIPLICWYLGMQGLLCTVTSKLQRGFERLKLPFQRIVTPDPGRLRPAPGVHWGSYYDTDPVTGLIRLDHIGHMFDTYCGRYQPPAGARHPGGATRPAPVPAARAGVGASA